MHARWMLPRIDYSRLRRAKTNGPKAGSGGSHRNFAGQRQVRSDCALQAEVSAQFRCLHRDLLGCVRNEVRHRLRGADSAPRDGPLHRYQAPRLAGWRCRCSCRALEPMCAGRRSAYRSETRAEVSLAGPLAGFFTALACAVLWWQTGNPLWAALARVGAVLNLLNLIPVWVLDGGQAVLALSKTERIVLLTAVSCPVASAGRKHVLPGRAGSGLSSILRRNLPAASSRTTTIYFVAVLTALGVIIHLMPGQGLGVR